MAHSRRHRKNAATETEPGPDVNTTPLIDVMLVLLVMLIITIPIQLHAVNLDLPSQASTPPPPLKTEVIQIDINAQSHIIWQGQPVSGNEELQTLMAAQSRKTEQPELHLRPHPRAKYEQIATVLASAQRQGLSKVGVLGSEEYAP